MGKNQVLDLRRIDVQQLCRRLVDAGETALRVHRKDPFRHARQNRLPLAGLLGYGSELAVDSRGDIYVGEVSYTNWPSTFPGTPVPNHLRSLQKLEKVV